MPKRREAGVTPPPPPLDAIGISAELILILRLLKLKVGAEGL
jgi:hypothetical protein